MKKSDLKSGMLVMTRNNERGIVMLNTPQGDCVVGSDGLLGQTWFPLNSLDENLLYPASDSGDADIIEVWSYSNNSQAASMEKKDRKLLWKRVDNDRVKLNDQYTAIINQNTKQITVGCQTIDFAKIDELYNMIHKNNS
jgi:hypothetical protein